MKRHFLLGRLLPKFIKIFAQNAIKNCPYFNRLSGYGMPVPVYGSKKQVTVLQKAFFAPYTSRNALLLGALFFLIGWGRACGQSHPHHITGSVISAAGGKPLEGATIKLKQGGRGVLTGKDGSFRLVTPITKSTLVVTNIGYKVLELAFDQHTQMPMNIRLEPDDNSLDEVQVIGYGQVSKRFNTGSVVTVTSEEIERQPVSNPLAALAGRVPGMTVTQSSGDPGAKVNIQIRGQNSISQGSQPLFIIDGIPFPNDNMGTGDVVMVNGGQSPFDNIVPGDIQQIDVLKDADATAIYGSRGANGVVLITTRKGKAGATKVDAAIYQGAGRITRGMDLLNTQQYVEMRKEAFANDGIEPTAVNAPDIMLWDTTRYTDWQHEFIGGTAHFTNANASLSGGNANTQFLLSGNYNRQTTVYPGEFAQNRGGGIVSVSHASSDQKFKAFVSANYSNNTNRLPSTLVSYINLPPNAPSLLDAEGNLVWSENGGTFNNPFDALFRKSLSGTENLVTNLSLDYEIVHGLKVRLSSGYNLIQVNDSYINPKAALNPNGNVTESSSTFANATNKSWILEPQLAYSKTIGNGALNLLVGGTIQDNASHLYAIKASGFPNDALLGATEFAKSVTTSTSIIDYRYEAVFSRLNYNYENKYLLNVTARRDGSSRFGPDRRIANFGAIGGAWIFSEELKSAQGFSWLSFGKFRASFGITGNDQIGDYQYLDNYGTATKDYQGVLGYIPSRLFNADYSWERNKKLEIAMEIGIFKNRLIFNTNWFRNRSDNQLINYKLPDQTGFPSILRNFGALVQNTGLEFGLSADVIVNTSLKWKLNANLTQSRNKLLEFEGLASSSYANSLVIGYPINIAKYLHWTGVDPQTGLYSFDGTSRPADQNVIADFTPKFFGGMGSNLIWGDWELDFLFQFAQQKGLNYLTSLGGFAPGTRYNQPTSVMGRWQKTGDETSIERFTTTGEASTAYNNYSGYSDARVTDASFLRLKNLYVGYSLPHSWAIKMKANLLKLYFQAQNIFTLTSYEGLDPETGAFSLPPLAISTIGIQLTL